MSRTLHKYFYERLASVFQDYLKEFSPENISQINLGTQNNFTLKGLKFREELLLVNSIPLIIKEGQIGKIKFDVPSLFKNTSMKIDIENVEIRVRLLVEHQPNKGNNSNPGEEAPKNFNYKQKKLDDWEAKVTKYFQELAPPTWARKVIDNILKNMSISIKNFNIYYENTSLMGHPTMIKISFKELTVHTTDANHTPAFNSGSDLHYREINISEFSVTLNLNKKKTSHMTNFHRRDHTTDSNAKSTIKITHNNIANQVTPDQKASVKGMFRYASDRNNLEDEYKKLRDHETYLVFPFDAIIRIRTQLDLSKDFRHQPMLEITLKFKEPIVLVLNTDNMKYLSALIDNFETMKIIQKNIHLRPGDRPQREPNSNIKLWWKYFKNAIIEDKKSSGNLINTTKWKINMKKYIDLYKRRQEIIHVPWLPHLSNEEKFSLMRLEEEIPLPNLLQFREWALIEIRIEAKRFFASNKDVQGIKPLIDIWSNAINNEEVFTSTKEKISDTIRLTPLEQSDLYDILRQDTAKVLESYLKGENNEPKDQMLSIVLSVKSFYVLVSEPKTKQPPTPLISPGFYKASSVPQVSEWIRASHTNFDGFIEQVKEQSNRSIEEDFNENGHDTDGLSTQRNEEEDYLSAKDDYHEESISMNKKQGRRGFSHRSNHNTNFDSFDEHLKDIQDIDPKEKHFKEIYDDEAKKEEKHENLTLDTEPNMQEWWNQNLILIVEILRTHTSLVFYRNEGLKTEKPLTCQNIMITTALNLQKATANRDIKHRDKHGLNYSELLDKILTYDFSANFRNKEHPLLNYLHENSCQAIAEFLKHYNNDRKLTGGTLNISDPEIYKNFFNRDHEHYLGKWFEFDEDFPRDSLGYLQIAKKDNLISKVFSKLHTEMNKSILPGFLYAYGVLVIPIMFKSELYIENEEFQRHLTVKEATRLASLYDRFPSRVTSKQLYKKAKTKDQKKDTNVSSSASSPTGASLQLSFSIEGTRSQFRIERIDLKKSSNGFGVEENNQEEEGSSTVLMNINDIKIFLSTESLKPLLGFINSLPSSSKDVKSAKVDDKMSVEDYHTLMSCIEYKHNQQGDSSDKKDEKKMPESELVLHSLVIIISNYLPTLKQTRSLEIGLQMKFSGRPAIGDQNVQNADKDDINYDRFYIQVKDLYISENVDSKVKTKIFDTKMSIYFYQCMMKNHPLFTDEKLHVVIPYMVFNLDNNLILFSEILQALISSNQEFGKTQKGRAPEFIPMGPNQKIMLSNRLNTLLGDHRLQQKNCKHCILRHKKSLIITNIFIGRLDQYCQNISETAFKNFEYEEILLEYKGDYPPGLSISIGHSLSGSLNKNSRALLNIQFISLTRDLGFFKDNLTIHCTESSPVFNNNDIEDMDKTAILAKFSPIIKTDRKFIRNLDDNYWKYFRELEKELASQSDITTSKEKMMKNVDSDEDSSKQLYLLLFRKKFLKTDVLKKFEIKGEEKNFSNYLIVRIKDFQIAFSTVSSFLAISSTLKNLTYLQEFFETFHQDKPNMPTHTPQAKDLEEIQVKTKTASLQKHKSTDEIRLKGFDFNKKKLNKFNIIEESKASSPSNKIQQANTSNEPKLYYDQSDIKKFIEKENISIIVDNFNLNIDILKSNQNVIEFKIEKLCLENFPDKTFHGLKSRLDIVDLLKIKSLSFRTTIQAKLNIEDVNIRYISGAIEFSINKIGFLSRSNEVPDIFAFKPEEGKQKNNHAIMMKIYFSSRLVEKIEVHLAPLQLCISDQEISTEISSISLINKLFASEETSYPKILEKEMFKGKFFDYVVKKMEQFKKEINDPVLISSTTPSHLGLLEANEDSKLIINCDKIYLQCRVGKTGFCKIKLSNLNFEQASDSNFKLDFDIISFEPHDTAYKNVFMSTRKDTPLRLSVRYANDYPEIVIKDAKLTYIARAIKELTLFNKEIKAKILENSDDLQERMNEKVGKLDSKAEEVVKEEPFLGIKIINSCLIIPRDSKSPDIFVGNFDEVEAKIKRVQKKTKMPKAGLHYRVVDNDQLNVEKNEWSESVGGTFMNVEATLNDVNLHYFIGDRNVDIGEARKIKLNLLIPDDDLFNHNWMYDGDTKVDLEDYKVTMNMASIEEMTQIITTNLRQQSDLFEKKPFYLEFSELVVKGDNLEATINKSIIPRVEADKLKQQAQNKNEKQEKKEFDAEKHVDQVLKEMKLI